MVEEELTLLYKKTKRQLAQLVEDMTFANFYRALQSGKRSYSLKNTEIVKTVDEEWVNAIKEAIPHIDSIVNNPRKYMKRETEVVPVEKAKTVDAESVRHLASHTNMINSVKNGQVRPNKILTAYNDESLELYENRFVVTLILKVSQFIDRRYFLLGAGGNEFSSTMNVSGEFEQAGEDTEYGINMTVHQGAEYFEGGVSENVYADLFMIRKYVTSFKYSPFMKAMGSCAPVRPPIMKTNLLVKEPNYAACLKLWDFVSQYDKAGYKIEVNDTAPQLTREEIDELDMLQVLQYLSLKNFMADFDERRRPMKKCDKKIVKPTLDEYETAKHSKTQIGAGMREFSMREAIDGSAQQDVEEAVKNAVIHALRKEQIKQEMREREEKEREDMLTAIVKEALQHNKEEAQAAQKAREQAAMQAIRDALKAEDSKYRQEKREEDKRERAVEKALEKQIAAFRNDERAEKEAQRREEKERERLMSAILSDMLKVEEDRRYVEENPVVMFGHERVPVPISAERLPMEKEIADFYYDMFTPPPVLSDEDWEEFELLKLKNRRPRRRLKEDALYNSIKRALSLERSRLRTQQRQEEERQQAQLRTDSVAEGAAEAAAAADAADTVQSEAHPDFNKSQLGDSGNNQITNDDGAQFEGGGVNDNGARSKTEQLYDDNASEEGAESEHRSGGAKEAAQNEGAESENTGSGGKSAQGENEDEEKRKSRLPAAAEQQRENWWQRLIRILFFWWRKKK